VNVARDEDALGLGCGPRQRGLREHVLRRERRGKHVAVVDEDAERVGLERLRDVPRPDTDPVVLVLGAGIIECEPAVRRHDQDLAVGGAIGDRGAFADELLLCERAQEIGERPRATPPGTRTWTLVKNEPISR